MPSHLSIKSVLSLTKKGNLSNFPGVPEAPRVDDTP